MIVALSSESWSILLLFDYDVFHGQCSAMFPAMMRSFEMLTLFSGQMVVISCEGSN